MSKVDYYISHVRYNTERTHIVKVRAYPNSGSQLGNPAEWARTEVVNAIGRGQTFMTMYKGADGQWKQGEDVRIVTIGGVKYIRTDNNSKAADNLGNLPEF